MATNQAPTVALETAANWCWILEEMYGAAMLPGLANARKAERSFAPSNKTEKLDA